MYKTLEPEEFNYSWCWAHKCQLRRWSIIIWPWSELELEEKQHLSHTGPPSALSTDLDVVFCVSPVTQRGLAAQAMFGPHRRVCHHHILPRRKRFVPKTLPSAIKPAWHGDRRNAITTNACIAPPWWRHLLLFLLDFFFGIGIYIHVKAKIYLWQAGQWEWDRVYIYVSIIVLSIKEQGQK